MIKILSGCVTDDYTDDKQYLTHWGRALPYGIKKLGQY